MLEVAQLQLTWCGGGAHHKYPPLCVFSSVRTERSATNREARRFKSCKTRMVIFRPNNNVSRELVLRRIRSVGKDLEGTSVEDVGDRLIGRVLETECEWRQL